MAYLMTAPMDLRHVLLVAIKMREYGSKQGFGFAIKFVE